MSKARPQTRYSVHPGIAMVQKWIETLPAKTGRSLAEWLTFIDRAGPATEQERRDWLKNEFKLGTNTAGWLAERSLDKGAEEDTPEGYLQMAEQYVEAMFSGAKAGLRPLYEELLSFCLNFAPDIKASPGKTIVPLYRHHVIAQLKPATRTRLDFGFALGGLKGAGRLLETGGFAKKDRITHRIEIKTLADIDAEVKDWFKRAYELDA
ncbi:MAG: DUF4287 domain-containing protein [Acidobacteria bacterium]|nr:DUF4287 domain-containing protein [Acidobacteriota bacterium]MBI3424102.1 DUF4287 domain-containing protein [Acidobacteriota bacterium]